MKFLLRLVLLLGLAASLASAAENEAPFTSTLTPEQKQRLGLGHLTPEQQTELDAAVAAYTRGAKTAAVAEVQQQAEVKIKEAKETAVAEYKKKEEPGVIAKTLGKFKQRQEEDKRERFTAHVVGEFRGWRGGTYFPLSDGQVWRQTGTETYELPPVQSAEVEIYQSRSGYWRLKYADAWISVKRVQ